MPFIVTSALVGGALAILGPYILIALGAGLTIGAVSEMIANPLVGISITVTVYWVYSVYISDTAVTPDSYMPEPSLAQGGRWCVTVRAASLTASLLLLAYVPIVFALIGIVAVIGTHISLEQSGVIVKQYKPTRTLAAYSKAECERQNRKAARKVARKGINKPSQTAVEQEQTAAQQAAGKQAVDEMFQRVFR